MASLSDIFSWFETGDTPTQDQFRATFSSFRHKENKIPFNEVEGLANIFENTVTNNIFTAFKNETNANIINLAKKDGSNLLPVDVISWKAALGLANVAFVDTLDNGGTVIIEGNVHTKEQVITMLDMLRQQVDGSYQTIEEIRQTLVSNDLDLDELQELVDYLKENRRKIELLQMQTGLENMVSEDNSLLIEPETKNIESNVSIFSQEFENFNNNVAVLSFPAIQILGVYDGGVKLNSNEYQLISPIRLELLAPRKHTLTSEFFPDVIEIQYTHLKTDLI